MQMIPQIGIIVFGVAAIGLVCSKGQWRRWGYVCGLCSQPFWFWETGSKGQWLLFALSVFYTINWMVGFRNHFLHKPMPRTLTERDIRIACELARRDTKISDLQTEILRLQSLVKRAENMTTDLSDKYGGAD